eukprot:1149467-Pelagomonas_calceolata.AAC.14
MKALRLELLLLLLLLLFVHFSALFTFTKGFITTRVELPHRSQCVDFSSRDGQQHKPAQDGERACWSTAPQHPHRIRKVVLMIVDALRADFYYEPEANISAAAAIIRDYSLHMPRLHAVVQEAVRCICVHRSIHCRHTHNHDEQAENTADGECKRKVAGVPVANLIRNVQDELLLLLGFNFSATFRSREPNAGRLIEMTCMSTLMITAPPSHTPPTSFLQKCHTNIHTHACMLFAGYSAHILGCGQQLLSSLPDRGQSAGPAEEEGQADGG